MKIRTLLTTLIFSILCIGFANAAISERYYIYCQIKPYVNTKNQFGWKITLKVKDNLLAKYLYVWKKDPVWIDNFLKGNFLDFSLTEGPSTTHSSYLTHETYFQNFTDAWMFGNDWIFYTANFIRQTEGNTVSIYFPEVMFIDNKDKVYEPPDDADFLCNICSDNESDVCVPTWQMDMSGRFTDNGDDTVTDNATCLTWQKTSSATDRNFTNGKAYCETLTLAGRTWRLPTALELESLVYNTGVPATSTSFPLGISPLSIYPSSGIVLYSATSPIYWTNSGTGHGSQFVIDFGYGYGLVKYVTKTSLYKSLCVSQ